ncbi:molybdopterin-guanine dinucleotide biosynthesis protein B [Neobacillus drentensis]|uniref:molybdopterin-guanine dinucleotide biosynthesis protein B n=1 Tax=Neobacillus drentensis TaxID=220684 RepID=UPI0008255910|nr:molybdopterin-guanine dinucleotide biosynthesis protein B [Neobacillus drentensis]
MAVVKPVIFQVVGYQNSGKTTITSKLINDLVKKGLKTVTIKHHGHGGKLAALPQKDTEKHLNAGALASIVEGEGSLILQADNFFPSLEEQIELMKFFHPDIILIEGYKQKPYPKLLLVRDESDLSLLNTVSNVLGILYWKEEMQRQIASRINVPSFQIDDAGALIWTEHLLQELVHKID